MRVHKRKAEHVKAPQIQPEVERNQEGVPLARFKDNRPEAAVQRRLYASVSSSTAPGSNRIRTIQRMINDSLVAQQSGQFQKMAYNSVTYDPPVQAKTNVDSRRYTTSISSETDVIQRSIMKGEVRYSFLPHSDINGNPYLSGPGEEEGSTKSYKIPEQQDNINLEEVESTAIEVTEGSKDAIKENLTRGRHQHVAKAGQEAYLEPFRSYQFGPRTRPDVAMFPIEEGEAVTAPLYKDLKAEIRTQVYNVEDPAEVDAGLERIKNKMSLLILAEEYRTADVSEEFERNWQIMLETLEAYRERGEDEEQQSAPRKALNTAILNCTTNLSFAGKGGKKKARAKLAKKKAQEGKPSKYVERKVRMPRTSMSPQQPQGPDAWQKPSSSSGEESSSGETSSYDE